MCDKDDYGAKIRADPNETGYLSVQSRTKWRLMSAALLLFWRLPNIRIYDSGVWGVCNLAKTDNNLWNPVPITKYVQLDCFTIDGATLSACI